MKKKKFYQLIYFLHKALVCEQHFKFSEMMFTRISLFSSAIVAYFLQFRSVKVSA